MSNTTDKKETLQDKVIEFLKRNPSSKVPEIAKAIDRKEKHTGVVLHFLKKKGLVKTSSYGRYVINDNPSADAKIKESLSDDKSINDMDGFIDDLYILNVMLRKYGRQKLIRIIRKIK